MFAEPANHDRVEEGGGCGSGPAGFPYRHAVKQIVAAARSLVVREADGFARFLARRAHEAVVVSLQSVRGAAQHTLCKQ
jgi:hypothetical protein